MKVLWQELRSLQSITDSALTFEKSYCEISVSFRESFIRKSSSSSSGSSSRPICMDKLLDPSFLNEVRSHFEKEKQFLEKEIQNISEYDQFTFQPLPLGNIGSYNIIESPIRDDTSICKNCHSSLSTVNSSSSSRLLQSKSTSSLSRNDSKQQDVQRICTKCKETMRRDKILNGRLPSNTPIDSGLHIPIPITLDNNSSNNSNITKSNSSLSATKAVSKSAPPTPSASNLKSVSTDNQNMNTLRMHKAYDDYTDIDSISERAESADVTVMSRLGSRDSNAINSRNSSSDGTSRNKIRNKIETAKDEHHFLSDF